VDFEESNIDKYIRIDNGPLDEPLFFGKVIYRGQRYIGKFQQDGACYIAVDYEEVNVPNVIEVLQYTS